MTIIAWDGRTLAADKRVSYGTSFGTVTKIARVSDSELVAAYGSACTLGWALQWLQAGRPPGDFPQVHKDELPRFLVVHRDGRLECFEGTPHSYFVESTQYAAGSGCDYAMAAMWLGHTAAEGVAVASALDPNCGNGIDTLTFDP